MSRGFDPATASRNLQALQFLQVVVPDECAPADFDATNLSAVDQLIKRRSTEPGRSQRLADCQRK